MASSVPAALPTVTGLLLARAASPEPGLRFEDQWWSWREHVGECARYAAALRARHTPGRPFHVGVLADNVPEFSFLLGGCAFAGAVLVALNPVRRGAALAADVARTDCQYVLADLRYAPLLAEADVPVMPLDGLELPAQAPLEPAVDAAPATPDDLLMLIFTSGTSGEPKAVRCTHGKIAVPGQMLAGRFGLGTADTVYVSMPMFHSNAIMYGVPDPISGDQVMACITLRGGASLTPAELGAFLAGQGDLGPRQHPRFVRVAGQMPRTATFKVLTRLLAADRWNTSDPVWWRPDGRSPAYVPLGPEQATALDAAIKGVR